MKKSILLFIPMYNCEKQIVRVLDNVYASDHTAIQEILIVDNRSSDNSVEAAKHNLSEMHGITATLVQNDYNVNLGGSHKVAFNYMLEKGFDHCIVLHGDDQADFKDITPHLKNGNFEQYENFLGGRFHKQSRLLGYSRFKTAGNIVLNKLIGLLFFKPVYDMGSGLNCYSRQYLESKHYLAYPDDLTFNVFLLFHALQSNTPLSFFPISWREYDQVSNAKVFKQASRILKLIARYCFRRKHVFTTVRVSDKNRYSYQVLYTTKADD